MSAAPARQARRDDARRLAQLVSTAGRRGTACRTRGSLLQAVRTVRRTGPVPVLRGAGGHADVTSPEKPGPAAGGRGWQAVRPCGSSCRRYLELFGTTSRCVAHHRRRPRGAAVRACEHAAALVEQGATHPAWPPTTDRVVPATGCGRDKCRRHAARALGPFPLLEEAIAAMGMVVWPMVAGGDDGLASAAGRAGEIPEVDQVVICTPDKTSASASGGGRIVPGSTAATLVSNKAGIWPVRRVPGVLPDSWPGRRLVRTVPGLRWGASRPPRANRYRHLESAPDGRSGVSRSASDRLAKTLQIMERGACSSRIATLRIRSGRWCAGRRVRWRGPTEEFAASPAHRRRELPGRAAKLSAKQAGGAG